MLDMPAWETIIREHGPSVWRTAYRLLSNSSDADDCMQETFVAAVSIVRCNGVQNWVALLQKLVVMRAIDLLRKRSKQTMHVRDESGLLNAAGKEKSPGQAVEEDERKFHLLEAIGRLPERQARIICMRYLSELTYEEIASALKMDVRHVGMVISRAREKLRELLMERGVT